jgi:hypothetical protein
MLTLYTDPQGMNVITMSNNSVDSMVVNGSAVRHQNRVSSRVGNGQGGSRANFMVAGEGRVEM